VAALPWNQWQLSRGMGGRLRLESVATLVWNTQLGPPRVGKIRLLTLNPFQLRSDEHRNYGRFKELDRNYEIDRKHRSL